MDTAIPQSLRYSLKYAGHPAGEQRLTVEPRRDGLRLTLEANVELPPPRTRQRWESEVDQEGLPRRYRERVEGNGARVMEVEFSLEDGLVTVSQGKDDFAIPYLTQMYDPLSLILAVGALKLEVGGVEKFALVGGRAYAERLPDQNLEVIASGEKVERSVRVYRLRPGLSLLYFDEAGYPVRLTQKVGEHIFEAELVQVERLEAGQRPQSLERRQETIQRNSSRARGVATEPGKPRVVSGEPPKEREKDTAPRRRRRRRRYN
ncbi:DUF3108 domain-containing protein [Meiothermus sp.]|jgi:hypothetical protein|uniref:DUF3108 domain-containing protein n=1 Tax=Meiothermus sp. TaxID=1955249 RepID=UPI0021DEC164|nr:DUF3108 domain-containing protein [Meiothermus sp.]GIW26436.1 MAG: hypothetical protein KatS3mg069_2703 [Meiothermus sp.]